MDLRDKILIDLYFPQFGSPPSSRFESLFLFLNKNDLIAKKKKYYFIYNTARSYNARRR